MSNTDNMKTIKITLPQQLVDELNRIKTETGIFRTEHIRRGLGMYVDYVNKKNNPTKTSSQNQ